MSRWSLCISLAERRTGLEAEWHCEVQPKHASGDAQSQSVECDAQAHTFVWVPINHQAETVDDRFGSKSRDGAHAWADRQHDLELRPTVTVGRCNSL